MRGSTIRLWLGADTARKEAALQSLKAELLPPAAVSVDYRRSDARAADEVAGWMQDLRLPPFHAPQRLLVLTHVDDLPADAQPALIAQLQHPPASSVVVLMSDHRKVAADMMTALAPALQVEQFEPPAGPALAQWITRAASQRGKQLAPEAARWLAERLPHRQGEETAIMEQLCLSVGERARIETSDVEHYLPAVRIATAFELLDALADGRVGRAVEIATLQGDRGRRVPEVLGAIGWQLRQLVQAHTLHQRLRSWDAVAQQLRVPLPGRRRFQRLCERLDGRGVMEAVRLAVEADVAVKTGRQAPQLALELLVVGLDRLISRRPMPASA